MDLLNVAKYKSDIILFYPHKYYFMLKIEDKLTEFNLNNVKELAQVNRILVSIFPPADISDG